MSEARIIFQTIRDQALEGVGAMTEARQEKKSSAKRIAAWGSAAANGAAASENRRRDGERDTSLFRLALTRGAEPVKEIFPFSGQTAGK